jgi:hypothetical protein
MELLMNNDDSWLGATVTYEGAPMALRVRPNVDTIHNRERFSQLVEVTHELAQVRPDGLPTPDYNESLAEFDAQIIEVLEKQGLGITVLVETYNGQRSYYAYVASVAHAKQAFEIVSGHFPQHTLALHSGADSEWGLYAEYRERFRW